MISINYNTHFQKISTIEKLVKIEYQNLKKITNQIKTQIFSCPRRPRDDPSPSTCVYNKPP